MVLHIELNSKIPIDFNRVEILLLVIAQLLYGLYSEELLSTKQKKGNTASITTIPNLKKKKKAPKKPTKINVSQDIPESDQTLEYVA